jgi:ATP-dependent RNA/DNA helicase IGHMBP2
VSEAAAAGGLSRTLFERLMGAPWGSQASAMLTVQYRMHKDIMDWSSKEMYGGALIAHPSVEGHTLADLASLSTSSQQQQQQQQQQQKGEREQSVQQRQQKSKSQKHSKGKAKAKMAGKSSAATSATTGSRGGEEERAEQLAALPVLLLIDTAGCQDMEEAFGEGDGSESRLNEGEAQVATRHVERLIAAGVSPADIGIIAPYNAQVTRLRELRSHPDVEISTVDGFQGREKEALVISATRSNPKGEVGFLSDARRMNVAVTRARRHCCLVCDTGTLASDAFLARLVAHFEAHGEYASAAEYAE